MAKGMELLLQALNASIQTNTPEDYIDDGFYDAREYFTDELEKRLASYPDTEDIIERYTEDPAMWEGVVVDAVHRLGLDEDEGLLQAARKVMNFSDMLGTKYSVIFRCEYVLFPRRIPIDGTHCI